MKIHGVIALPLFLNASFAHDEAKAVFDGYDILEKVQKESPNINSAYSQPRNRAEHCICVPYYRCEDGYIVNDGEGVIQPRKRSPIELPVDEKCEALYHVCCRDPEYSANNSGSQLKMMKIYWLIALILCLSAACAQDDVNMSSELDDYEDDLEEDENDSPNVDSGDQNDSLNIDSDYSQPGVPTENCVCVPFYQCEDGKIVDDGSNIIDPRRRPTTDMPLDEKPIPGGCGPFEVCCTDPEASTVKPYVHRCGTRNPSGINGRILSADGKDEAEFGEWPWQAIILKKEGDAFVFTCGGTLIDEQHVLTVAHCAEKFLKDLSSLVVRLGEWDTQKTTEFLPHEDFGVERIINHPQYRANNLFNDISVLKLDKPVSFKPHIDTVCLPRDEDSFVGEKCVITGWGKNAYKNGKFSLIMKEITVPVIDSADCQKRLRTTKVGRYFKLHGSFLCAGGEEGVDSCTGDGGGPLVCYRSKDNSYTLAGLVSWGIECGRPDIPGVYVNVQKFIDWISSATKKPIKEYWSS